MRKGSVENLLQNYPQSLNLWPDHQWEKPGLFGIQGIVRAAKWEATDSSLFHIDKLQRHFVFAPAAQRYHALQIVDAFTRHANDVIHHLRGNLELTVFDILHDFFGGFALDALADLDFFFDKHT